MAESHQNWPDRRLVVIVPSVTLCVISTLFLIWRLAFAIMSKRKIVLCDYLLIIAESLNIATSVLRFMTTNHGLGRHITDPSITLDDLLRYSYLLWIQQILNVLGVAFLKISICLYLLALKFSKIYVYIIWFSIAMVTSCNFLMPMLTFFGCVPLEANWNRGMKPEYCWAKGNLAISYSQGVSNVITDIIYIVAPLIYLSTVQIPRRTQWGLRIVFLLGLIATITSIFKTVELRSLSNTTDPTWDGVDLSVWSASELSVGILIASLPPLRKVFDKFFRRILPTSLGTRGKPSGSIPLYNISRSRQMTSKRATVTAEIRDDGSSERAMLPEEALTVNDKGQIIKTTTTEVTSKQKTESTHRSSMFVRSESSNDRL